MSQSSVQRENFYPTSPLLSLIDQIEGILNSPAEFTSSTSQSVLPPLLSQINLEDASEELEERVIRLEKWCGQLSDATRAAETREIITRFLNEVEGWDEWQWSINIEDVQEQKGRVNEIKKVLSELPIEWLKSRITGFPPFFQQKQFY